jgi:hypothetical protein
MARKVLTGRMMDLLAVGPRVSVPDLMTEQYHNAVQELQDLGANTFDTTEQLCQLVNVFNQFFGHLPLWKNFISFRSNIFNFNVLMKIFHCCV